MCIIIYLTSGIVQGKISNKTCMACRIESKLSPFQIVSWSLGPCCPCLKVLFKVTMCMIVPRLFIMPPCLNIELRLVLHMIRSAHCVTTTEIMNAVWQVYSSIFLSSYVHSCPKESSRSFIDFESHSFRKPKWTLKLYCLNNATSHQCSV